MEIHRVCYFEHLSILFTSTPENMRLFLKRRWKVRLRTPSFVLRVLGRFGETSEGTATVGGIAIFCGFWPLFFQLEALDEITDMLRGLAMNVNAIFLAVQTAWKKKVSGGCFAKQEQQELPYTDNARK